MKTYHSALTKFRLSVLSAILLPFCASAATENDVAQMLYRYTFEGTETAIDLPANKGGIGSLAAQLTGTPVYATDKYKFGEQSFWNTNGDFYLEETASGIDGLNSTTGYTLSWWAYLPATVNRVHLSFTQGSQVFAIAGGSGNGQNLWINRDWTRIGNTVSYNTWVHFAVVVGDNGTIYGYANGQFNTGYPAKELPAGAQGLLKKIRIGAGDSGAGKLDNCGIDEVAVFDRPLSQAAVQWLAANPAGIPFLRPQIIAGEDTSFFTATWNWPDGSSNDKTAPGDLVVMGSGARTLTMDDNATVAGNLTVLQSEVGPATSLTIAATTGKLTVEGSTTLRNDTIIEAGAATLANIILDPGKNLTVNDAASLSGSITIQSGSTLDLSRATFPLTGVTSLTIAAGATLRIPGELPLQVLDDETAAFSLAGQLQDAQGEPIAEYTVNGTSIIPPVTTPLVWNAAEGTWSRTIWESGTEPTTNNRETTFEDAPGSETATVNVSGTVAPATLAFANPTTAYTFTTSDGGNITLPDGIPLATFASGAPVVFNLPLTFTGNVTVSESSSLTFAPFLPATYSGAFTLETGSALKLGLTSGDATLGGALAAGTEATLEVNTASGKTATLNAAFTGAGTIRVTGEGTVKQNYAAPNFTGQVQVSGATLNLGDPNNGGSRETGLFSNAAFRTKAPVTASDGAGIHLSNYNPMGWNTGNAATTFAELGDGCTLKALNTSSPLISRGLSFTGNTSVITESPNGFRFFLGITLKAEGGMTTFSKSTSAYGYDINGTIVGANSKVIFDVGEEAQIMFDAPLHGAATADTGIRKTGPGTLTFTAGALTFTSGAANDTAASELNAGITELTSTATANGNWVINSGATLTGTGQHTGEGIITVNGGGIIKTGLTAGNLALTNGGIVSIAAATPTLTVSESIAVPPGTTAIIDAGEVAPGNNYGKILEIITWPEGAAPEGTFTLAAGQSKTFTLKTEPTGLALYRVSGILISLY